MATPKSRRGRKPIFNAEQRRTLPKLITVALKKQIKRLQKKV